MSVSVLELRIKNGDDEATLERAAKSAHEMCENAFVFFKKNRLYLSKELSDSINRILSTMELTSVSYPYAGTIRTNALNIWNEQSQQISSIMSHLEQEFRIMLGSESAKIEALDKTRNSSKFSDE